MASILKKLRGGSKRKKTSPQKKISTESSHEAALPTSSKALHDDDDHTHPLQEFSPSHTTPQKDQHHHHHKLHVPSFFKKHTKKQASTPDTCSTIDSPQAVTPPTANRRIRLSTTKSIPTHVATTPQKKPLKSSMKQRPTLAVDTSTSVVEPTVLYRNIDSAKKEKRPSTAVPDNNNTSQPPPNQTNTNTNNAKTQSIRDRNRETERVARAAAALDNKGNELFERGYYDKAMATYSKALKLKRRTFHKVLEEADDVLDDALEEDACKADKVEDQKLLVSMATSINNIGYLRQRSGDATPDETMVAYKKSLRIKREILGKDSLSVGKTLNNIGSVHYLKHDYDGALSAYEEALQIMQSNLGAEHPDVATVWSNMGDVYLGKKSQSEALERYRYALTIRWMVFGEHDQRVVRLLEKIAAIEMGGKMMEETRKLLANRQQDESMYHGEDSEILDLDMRPVEQELKELHHEVEEDIQHVSLLQKRMAVDMLKDKVIIFRGMRELMAESERNVEDSTSHQLEESSRTETEDHDDDPEPAGKVVPLSPKRLGMTGAKRYEGSDERAKALQNVKDRVARLREQRMTPKDVKVEGHNSLGSIDHVVEGPTTRNSLFGASLYSKPKRPTNASLSHLEANELKGAADSVVSALALKRGITALRDFSMDEKDEAGKAKPVL